MSDWRFAPQHLADAPKRNEPRRSGMIVPGVDRTTLLIVGGTLVAALLVWRFAS